MARTSTYEFSSDALSLYKTVLSLQVYSLGPHPTKVPFLPFYNPVYFVLVLLIEV